MKQQQIQMSFRSDDIAVRFRNEPMIGASEKSDYDYENPCVCVRRIRPESPPFRKFRRKFPFRPDQTVFKRTHLDRQRVLLDGWRQVDLGGRGEGLPAASGRWEPSAARRFGQHHVFAFGLHPVARLIRCLFAPEINETR